MYLGVQDVKMDVSAAGTTQADAQLLVNGINYVETVASGAGVRLNVAQVGVSQMVYNAGANPLLIYPPDGCNINQLSADAAITLATNTNCAFVTLDSTQIIAMLSA